MESTCKQESMPFCWFSVAVITYGLKAMWGGMGSFQLTTVHAEGQPGQELKAGICGMQRRDPGEMLHPGLLLLACPVSSLIQFRTIYPGWHYPQWAGSSLINHQLRSDLQIPSCQSNGGIFSMSVSFSQMVVLCVKLT